MAWNSLPISAAGSLAVSAVALFFVSVQSFLFIKRRKFASNGWAALFSLSTTGYAFFVFLQYIGPPNEIQRIFDQVQASCLVLMAHSLCGYTFSYLKVRGIFYHWIGGALNAAALATVWLSNLVVSTHLVSLTFLWLPRPYVQSDLGPLGAPFMGYIVVSALFAVSFWIARRPDENRSNKSFGLGLLLFVAFGVHDALASLGIIHTVQFLLEYGFLGFATTIFYFTLQGYIRLESQALTLERMNRELGTLARTDSVTKLANRYSFDQQFEKEWRRLQRQRRQKGLTGAFSLLLCDVDFFTEYNDTYGHPAGDRCLVTVAGILAMRARRSSDFACRYGGDEFAVLLPDTPIEGAREVASAIIADLRALQLEHRGSPAHPWVTVSIGVSTVLMEEDAPQNELVVRADRALYLAKTRGRDRAEELTNSEAAPSG
jgi:diguanylate cyclase (GGDEF)-like protein